jgi:hypothetical protein
MQATWLLSLAAQHLGQLPSVMHYRGTAAYIEGDPATVALISDTDTKHAPDQFTGMVITASGIKTMEAQFQI